jgi:hypothetical protein
VSSASLELYKPGQKHVSPSRGDGE